MQSLAVDNSGNYMATAGLDGQMKIWDIRKFQPVNQYFTIRPAASMDISQQGLLAVGCGPHVQIWKDALRTKAKSPYMTHMIAGEEVRRKGGCFLTCYVCLAHIIVLCS